MAQRSQFNDGPTGALRRVSSSVRATDAAAARVVSLPAAAIRRAVSPTLPSRPVSPSELANPEGSAAAMLSFWFVSRLAIVPALRPLGPCSLAIVPMMTGAKAASRELLGADPNPTYL